MMTTGPSEFRSVNTDGAEYFMCEVCVRIAALYRLDSVNAK
jgi:hypothetical protein